MIPGEFLLKIVDGLLDTLKGKTIIRPDNETAKILFQCFGQLCYPDGKINVLTMELITLGLVIRTFRPDNE